MKSFVLSALVASSLIVLGTGCHPDKIEVNDVAINPSTATKGESLSIEGNVYSMGGIKSVSITVLDPKTNAVPQGISISSTAFGDKQTTWDLKKDAAAKVVTTPSAPSGSFRVKIEAQSDGGETHVETADFTVK